MRTTILIGLLGAAALVAGCGRRSGPVSFRDDIQPILRSHCTMCHNSQTKSGGLDYSSYDSLMTTRYVNRPGPVVIGGKPEESRLFIVITTRSGGVRMPPDISGLPSPDESDVALIRQWIEEGAKNN